MRRSIRWQFPAGRLRLMMALALLLQAILPLTQVQVAQASTVSSAAFTGGADTASVGGTLYAKQGASLTLTVNTSADTKCVELTGAFTGRQTSTTAKSIWTFNFTAGTGDGIRTVTASASPNFNQNNCTGQSQSPQSASFTLDNTLPVVTGALSPTPNAAGWNNGNVTINWTATDAGSGIASGPTPATDSVTANTSGVNKTATATDRVGNTGSKSLTIKLDKEPPTITGNRLPPANGNGWNNTNVTVSFSCSDALSGIKSCPGESTTFSNNGANQSVSGTAVDNADNSAGATVGGINIDKDLPALSGAPTTPPNASGWYNTNVTIHWTAGDALSGLAGGAPADSTISSEGQNLTASASVADLAGNTATATSSPAVKIDKTAPNTTATAPGAWKNTDVTVALNAADALSGVAATYYMLDGGAQQAGASVSIASEGVHTLQFWSVDNAGNTEAAKTVQVKIDKTPPTINHTQQPGSNANGWNNTEVTVTFICDDSGGSGIASCTAPQTVTSEGKNQPVTGTALDNAGNTATDPATVSIDKTAPTISAAADRAANPAGWYNADVTVNFICNDALSGIDACPAAQTFAEGANQSASGAATDAAGNTASAGVSGINVDKTAPTITGAPTTPANAAGWYNGDVTVHWTCSDSLSGVVACPPDSTVTGEDNGLSTGATLADQAGNSATTFVQGIKIDRHAPATTASVPDPFANGWYKDSVPVTLAAVDNLSGIYATGYRVDADPNYHPYAGPFTVSGSGSHTVYFYSVDNAGNVEDVNAPGHTITFKIDGVPPTITGKQSPLANANGWNNSAVEVSFDCADNESGIASCTTPVSVTAEGDNWQVPGQAVDAAGNSAGATYGPVKIDLTPPTTSDDATAGWKNTDVTVQLAAVDNLSGIAYTAYSLDNGSAQQGNSVAVTAEGVHELRYYSVDKADNAETVKTAVPIQIDKTNPTISGAADRAPNGNGWYNADVTVSFTCNDDRSGVAMCEAPHTLGEGANQSVSGNAKDQAGNSAGVTVSGINVDKTAPSTTASATGAWINADVTVNFAAQDALSGVAATYYKLDGGPQQAGGSVQVSAEGDHTLDFWSVDNAGNAEVAKTVHVKIDKTKPTITHTQAPAANSYGWNNSDVTVTFACADTPSGVASCTAPQTVTTEGQNQLVAGTAIDNAANTATDSASVSIDKTKPTISGAADRAPNAAGWYKADVTVSFTCADDRSGVATCEAPHTLGEGANQSVSGNATDKAGNSAGTAVSGLNVDKTAPTLSGAPTIPPDGSNGWYKTNVTIHWTASDGLSGLAGAAPADAILSTEGENLTASASVSDNAGNTANAASSPAVKIDKTQPAITWNGGPADGGVYYYSYVPGAPTCTASDALSGPAGCTVAGYNTALGLQTMTATAYDKAGNSKIETHTYTVKNWTLKGFYQPVDMSTTTATVWNTVKGGSTVPLKFEIFTGLTELTNTGAVKSITSAEVNCSAGAEDAVEEVVATTGGTVLRYDATSGQFIDNWATPKRAGACYRVTMTAQDNSTLVAYFKLK